VPHRPKLQTPHPLNNSQELYELRNLLFIDLETVACARDYAQLSPTMQKLWQRRARRVDETADPAELFPRSAGLFPEFGQIVCIGVGYFYVNEQEELSFRVKSFAGPDEQDLLHQFKELLEHKFNRKTRLVAHNGKEFDYPYLCRRMLINRVRLPEVLQLSGAKPWEVRHLDTMEMWRFGDRRNLTSLKLLASVFGIETTKDSIDGSMVNDIFYTDNDLKRIAAYCRNDVVVTAQIYLAMKTLPNLKPDNIFEV
jgi:3'-5' exonuclease